jgi:hypothetical protein
MGNGLVSHPGVKGAQAELDESLDPFPPPRSNSLPPLESREAQSLFLTSPTAVVESLGLRIPKALSQHIKRRSSLPPPPGVATEEVSGVQRVADVLDRGEVSRAFEAATLPPPPKVPAEFGSPAAPQVAAVARVAAVEPAPPAVAAKPARKGGRRKKS